MQESCYPFETALTLNYKTKELLCRKMLQQSFGKAFSLPPSGNDRQKSRKSDTAIFLSPFITIHLPCSVRSRNIRHRQGASRR